MNQKFKHYKRYSLLPILLFTFLLALPLNIFAQSLFDNPTIADQNLVDGAVYLSVSEVVPGETYHAALVASIVKDWHINSNRPNQDYLIPAKLLFDANELVKASNIIYPKAEEVTLLGEKMSVYEGEIKIFFDITVDENVKEEKIIFPVKLDYQGCNNYECKNPTTIDLNLTIDIGDNPQPINDEIFSEYKASLPPENDKAIDATESSAGNVDEESEIAALINKYGFWGYFMALGVAFLTGLLLSFSPCTYPMIPITVSVFAGQQRSIGRGFVLSLFYVTSMAVMYGIMGLIISLIGGVFGSWLANPIVVVSITVIFVIFALSMFGLFEIQVPQSMRNKLGTTKTGGGVGGVILLGIIAALIVSPCVGPFAWGIMVYISTFKSPIFGFLVLFVFAMGLGTLYIIIGTFSSTISKLPKAGEWMEQIKKFFGFVLLLMAVYFLRTLISESLVAILTAFILLVLAIFGGGFDRLTAESTFFHRLKKFIGIIAFIAALYLLLGTMLISGFILPKASEWLPISSGGSSFSQIENKINWNHDLEDGLAKASKSGKPVLIDTWATWCVNCKVLDKKTLSDPLIIEESKRFVPLKIQLETQDSFETIEFMKRFNLKSYSLPTLFLLDSNGKLVKKLQGVVSVEELLDEMKKL